MLLRGLLIYELNERLLPPPLVFDLHTCTLVWSAFLSLHASSTPQKFGSYPSRSFPVISGPISSADMSLSSSYWFHFNISVGVNDSVAVEAINPKVSVGDGLMQPSCR